MLPKYYVDIECRSLLDIKKAGNVYPVSRYTQITIISITSNKGHLVGAWSLYDESTHNQLQILIDCLNCEDIIFAGHNGLSFDFPCLISNLPVKIKHSVDTISLFAPFLDEKILSLDVIARQFGRRKNEQGKDLIIRLCLPKHFIFMGKDESFESYSSRTEREDFNACFSWPSKKQASDFLRYCNDDTKELYELNKLIPQNPLDDARLRLFDVDRKLNYNGLRVDTELCNTLITQAEIVQKNIIDNCGVPLKVLSSPQKLVKHVKEHHDVVLTSCSMDYLDTVLNMDDTPDAVKDLLIARMQISRRADAKIKKILQSCIGDRVYNYIRLFGAHTGRATSGGWQAHNVAGDPDEIAWKTLDFLLALNNLTTPQQIQVLTRLVFIPDNGKLFYICDYSGVEARIAAWVSGDTAKIKGFRDGIDFYILNAAGIYDLPADVITKKQRKVGKVAELGGGYQMGGDRFVDYAGAWGVRVTIEEARKAIETFRDQNEALAGHRTGKTFYNVAIRSGGIWKALQNAFFDVIFDKQSAVLVAKCVVSKFDGHIRLTLPSGRDLFYRNIAVKMAMKDENDDTNTIWAQSGGEDYQVNDLTDEATRAYRAEGYRPQIVYGFKQRKKLYGGKILENVCQAIGACLLMDALVRIDNLGLDTVLHVHDEVVVQIDDTEDDNHHQISAINRIMSNPPKWAEGLPLACEGFVSTRFAKNEKVEEVQND